MANPTNTNKNRAEDRTSHAAASAMDKAKDVLHDAKDTAQGLADKARDVASNVGHKVGEAASNVGHGADRAVQSAGSGMQSFADTVRERGPQSGMFGSATSAVADSLDTAGEYLESHGLSGIAEDVTNLVRRNPIPALLIGIGVGYLLARATRS
jgi:hypothetical protein